MYIMNKSCCKKQQNFLTSKLIIKHINKMIKSLMLINAYYCLILKYHRFNGNQVILTRNPNKWVEIHALSGNVASAAWSGPAGGAEKLGYRSLQHYNFRHYT